MYDALATVYDLFQTHDWPVWADYIHALDQHFSQRKGRGDGLLGRPILLDLGCGTGGFCLEMARRGYDPIGIDQSLPMLNEAQKKAAGSQTGHDQAKCLFLRQDITSFELFGTVDLVVCLMDTLNHLMTDVQITRMLQLCEHYLNPGCLMVFDVLTKHHMADVLSDQFFFDDQPDYTVFWQNHYDHQSCVNQAGVTLFSRQTSGLYRRSDELIEERYLSESKLEKLLAATSFEQIPLTDPLLPQPPRDKSERVFFLLRKH